MGKAYDVTVYAKTYLTTVIRVDDAENEDDAAAQAVEQAQDDVGAFEWEEPLAGIESEDIDESLSEVNEAEDETKRDVG